jgi:hypothetical protein
MRRRRYRKSQTFHEVARQVFDSARILLQLKSYARIMAVMMPREKWTDERLDDLNKKVDDGFTRLDGDIRELRGEVKDLRGEMNARFDKVNERFDALNGRLFGGFFVLVAAIIGSNAF